MWDWAAGRNFVTAMSEALARADRVVALFSAAYFEPERYTTEEWSASLVHVPGVAAGRLVPVRVEEVPADLVPPLLRPLVSRDVFGVAEEEARRALLAAVAGPARPAGAPGFPGRPGPLSRLGGAGPRLPGVLPPVWGNVPPRNPGFTGRDQMLADVRQALLSGGRAVVQALAGMGGVGKTQLAAEYAHRFASGYDVVWWIAAEQAALIGEQIAALAAELASSPGRTRIWAGRGGRCLVSCGGGTGGCWCSTTPRPRRTSTSWLPGGAGHVLITSRVRGWAEVAMPVEVDVLARRGESVAILQDRVPGLADGDADRAAAALGDLPLAMARRAAAAGRRRACPARGVCCRPSNSPSAAQLLRRGAASVVSAVAGGGDSAGAGPAGRAGPGRGRSRRGLRGPGPRAGSGRVVSRRRRGAARRAGR